MTNKKFQPLIDRIKKIPYDTYRDLVSGPGKSTWSTINAARVGDTYMPSHFAMLYLCDLAQITPENAINHPETETT